MAAVLTEPDTAKAAVTGPDGGMLFYSFPIEKVTDSGDGTVEVAGAVTDGSLDSDLQVVDPAWSEKALKEWFDTGANIRVQHQAQRDPAGKGVHLDGHYLRARIVEPTAVKLVKAGVLQDFSIGIMNPDVVLPGQPRYSRLKHLDPMGKAIHGIITGRPDGLTKVGEVSAVDRGSNFSTRFAFCKAAGDGSCEYVNELTAPDDVIAKVAKAPKSYKTVSVDLPASMRIKVSPATLAKMNTLAQQNAPKPVAAAKAAEPDAVKRDFDPNVGEHGTDRDAIPDEDFAGRNKSFPVTAPGDVSDALQSIGRAGADNYDAKTLRKRILAIARRKGFPVPKGSKKVAKAAEPDVTKCMTCNDSGESDGKPCPDCKAGKKAAKAAAALDAAVSAPVAEVAKKKSKVMCGSCGAKQNSKHVHCPECGNALYPGAMPAAKHKPAAFKNHDFNCLNCGREDLDKGEKFCPGCGTENPGYLPQADQKIPANKAASKERVASKKAKKKAGKKGKMPFGGNQAKPFGQDDDADAKDDAKAKPKAEKRRKGKGRSPAEGVRGHEGTTAPLPPHREPDGPAVEAFEGTTNLGDGDCEMKAAMRHRDLGVDPALGILHDLTCPAFSPADVAKCFPHASLAVVGPDYWQAKALEAASGSDLITATAGYNEYAGLSLAAVTLKTADPRLVHDIRLEGHQAFLRANKKALKSYADATPGPGSFPTPAHVTPGQFRRPYIGAGHAAPSPQHDGARSFAVPEGQTAAQDFTRGYLTAGHAADSPANSTPRHMPQPAPMTGGMPETVHYQGTMRDNAAAAISAMHDHVSRIFPDVCPMSPQLSDVQKPAPGVPQAVGGPIPHAGKSAKPKAAKGAAKKAGKPKVTKAAAPQQAPPVPDADAITAAVKAATAPLLKTQARQDRLLKKQRKTLDAIAGQRDTTGAPFRGAGVYKASAAPAGPLTVAQSAEQAQGAHLQRLHKAWRTSPDPGVREAAYTELTSHLGINPVTDSTHPAETYPVRRLQM